MTKPPALTDNLQQRGRRDDRSPSADTDLVPDLIAAFPAFEFSMAPIDDDYWRDTRFGPSADGPDRRTRPRGRPAIRLVFPDDPRPLVDPDVGLAIATGLKAQRVRLPDRDAAVLLRRADRTYGF
jgi:hypothetical protein